MNEYESNRIMKEASINLTDKVYGEQYTELFPDVEPPVQTLDELDVGDVIFSSDEFIRLTLEYYNSEAGLVGGTLYKPPSITDIGESIRNEYMEEIIFMEDEGLIDDATLVTFGMDEAAVVGTDIDPRIMEVLDAVGLTYLYRDFISKINPITGKKETEYLYKVMNTSTINLFDFEYSNLLIDRSSKYYEQSIQEGYNNLLRINLE